MVLKEKEIIAVAVIIIVIVAGLAIVLANNEPDARAMILDANDVQASEGGQWKQISSAALPGRMFHSSKSEAFSSMSNETIGVVYITVVVFENDNASQAAFPYLVEQKPPNGSNPQIGNESYTSWSKGVSTSVTDVFLTFRERNVLVSMGIASLNDFSWLNNTAISLGRLQLQKIDQYLT